MRRIYPLIGLSIVLALNISFVTTEQQNGSVIAISAKSVGTLQKGYGIIVTLTNIQTKESFESNSLGPISAHSIITDLPAGTYIVTKVKVPVGSLMYVNWSESVTSYFGQLKIQPNKNYYLGNFIGTRAIGRENVLSLKIEDENIPDELFKKLSKKKYNLESFEFEKTYSYSGDELMVY